jgi:hypothetical protein
VPSAPGQQANMADCAAWCSEAASIGASGARVDGVYHQGGASVLRHASPPHLIGVALFQNRGRVWLGSGAGQDRERRVVAW